MVFLWTKVQSYSCFSDKIDISLEDHQFEVLCLGKKQYAEEGKAVFTARVCI